MLGLSLNALRDGLIGAAGHVVAMPVSRGFESGVLQISSGLKSVVVSIFSYRSRKQSGIIISRIIVSSTRRY
jgi:hypothetical protein